MPAYFDPADYGLYFEHDFRHRWLRPQILADKLKKYQRHESLHFEEIGRSVEQRPISVVKWGGGPTRLLLWTQMHGNEPTATMAAIDLLNFLTADDQYNGLRQEWSQQLSVHIVLMLNPDGSENFTRINALQADLNRDAQRQAMPEMQALSGYIKKIHPHWGFNLHDQRNIFSVGTTGKPATMSFQAPAIDTEGGVNAVREKSMRLISLINQVLQKEIPGCVGRYNEKHYPRSIGEYFHEQQVPCLLFECGAALDDGFRDMSRKMCFLSLCEAFSRIARSEVGEGSKEGYFAIPENETNFYDLIFRQVYMPRGEQTFTTDLGLLLKEEAGPESGKISRKYLLAEVGDLQFHTGFKEEKELILDGSSVLKIDAPASFSLLRSNGNKITFKNGILHEKRQPL